MKLKKNTIPWYVLRKILTCLAPPQAETEMAPLTEYFSPLEHIPNRASKPNVWAR